MREKNSENTVYPPAVMRALEILDYFTKEPRAISAREISDVLKIPYASTYRLIKCLLDYGYLRVSPDHPEKYKLGYKPTYLSKMAFDGVDLITAAVPHLKRLASRTSQACQLCVLSDAHVITLDQALPHDAITIIAKLGEPIPINVSASGKVLYSRLRESKRRALLSKVWHTYSKNTENTVMDLETFLKHLNDVSKQSYATDIEEFAAGIGCLAVPILDFSGEAKAAVGLTGPIENYKTAESFDFMLKALLQASREISEDMYTG
jgi:DNA-binding IclR family transcriptional regulator